MLAVTQLSIVPMPVSWPKDGERPDVAGWYPLVGLAVALPAWGLVVLGHTLSSPLLFSALAVAATALLTRGLHWDGLADVADAWNINGAERRHEVMKDSATGAFGALAICLGVVLQVVAISSLADKGASTVVLVAAIAGRAAATFSAWLGAPARTDGLGAAVSRRPGFSGALGFVLGMGALVGLVALAVAARHGMLLALAVGAGLAAALVVPHVISGRFGGTSGDTMGASIVVVETTVLVFSAIVVAL
jgi:adenosylcobinamide-GDP ribazoletransferase